MPAVSFELPSMLMFVTERLLNKNLSIIRIGQARKQMVGRIAPRE